MHNKETIFTDKEINYIKQRYEIDGPKIIGILLNRSTKSISKKAKTLGLYRGIGYANSQRENLLPKKTCIKCGRNFPASGKYFYRYRYKGKIPEGIDIIKVLNSSVLTSSCRECCKKERQERYLRTKEQTKRINALWREKNKEKLHISFKKWRQTPKGRFTTYRSSAKAQGHDFNLSFSYFKSLWNNNCYYCGDYIEGIGLDRLDNNKGYLENNVVPCCEFCNKMKMDHSVKELLNQVKKIYQRLDYINDNESKQKHLLEC